MANVSDMRRKRKANGCDYISKRVERAKAQMDEKMVENAVLQRLLGEHKRNVEELTEQLRAMKVLLEEQKSNVQELTVVTLAGYCVCSTTVPRQYPIFFFAPSEWMNVIG